MWESFTATTHTIDEGACHLPLHWVLLEASVLKEVLGSAVCTIIHKDPELVLQGSLKEDRLR